MEMLKKSVSKLFALSFIVMVLMTISRRSWAGDDASIIGRRAPEIAEGTWLNSKPLTLSSLRGKVVLLEFWTYGCYNCRNTLPYVKSWYRKYAGEKFTVIGVHTPEFSSEKLLSNVERRIGELGIEYPVVTDNGYKSWDAYHQQYWPVVYLIDKGGTVRYKHIGEGAYDETERQILALIAER